MKRWVVQYSGMMVVDAATREAAQDTAKVMSGYYVECEAREAGVEIDPQGWMRQATNVVEVQP